MVRILQWSLEPFLWGRMMLQEPGEGCGSWQGHQVENQISASPLFHIISPVPFSPSRETSSAQPTSQRGIQRYSKSLSQRLRYEFISQSHILDSESLSHSLTGLLCSLPARGWGSVWGVLGAETLGPRTGRIKFSFITCEVKELLHAWITTLNHWGSAWSVNHAQGIVPDPP